MNMRIAKILPFLGILMLYLGTGGGYAQIKLLGATGEQWIGGPAGSSGGIRFEVILKKPRPKELKLDSVYVGYADSGQWVPAQVAIFDAGKWIIQQDPVAPRKLDTFQLRCAIRLLPTYQKPVYEQDIIHQESKLPWVKPPVAIVTNDPDRIILVRYQHGKKYRYFLVDQIQVKKLLVP